MLGGISQGANKEYMTDSNWIINQGLIKWLFTKVCVLQFGKPRGEYAGDCFYP